jgi:serine protease Do
MTQLLEDLTTAGRGVAQGAARSVVGVGRRGSGIVLARGAVATNAHNLHHDEVEVVFADGRRAVGTVRAADLDGDLAVVAVDTGDAPPLDWADEAPDPGTPVFALANPGGRGARVSFGIVSSTGRSFRGPRGRRIAGSIEHTAPLARGSSGGALVDASGRGVGLNTHRLGDGFYLAIPMDAVQRARLDDLASGQQPARRSLGVAVVPPRIARRLRASVGLPERDGLLVRDVDPSGPGAAGGIREGDLIIEAAGQPIAAVDELHAVLDGSTEPSIGLVVVRGTDEHALTIAFGPAGEPPTPTG